MKHYLAFDLGASSGRAIIGTLDNGKLTLQEVHRFENGPVTINGRLFWDIALLFSEMKKGLRLALDVTHDIASIAIDTWGVDYALFDKDGFLTGLPVHYRDARNESAMPITLKLIPREKLYDRTGIQFLQFNSIFQLAASKLQDDAALKNAETMLFIPNALTYLFSGNISAEYSIATTSQLYNPVSGDWAWDIIDTLILKHSLFPKIVPSCSPAGVLREDIQQELKCGPIPVVLVGSHDTASAVAAVPAVDEENWAYLSSGTWSLLGIELDKPLLTAQAMEANYTNEGGLGGKIRFLKNIMGLWLVQECRNEWKRCGSTYSWNDLVTFAEQAEPLRSFINPDDTSFVTPGDMPERIRAFCRAHNEPVPETPGQIIRTGLESLALRYRRAIEEIENITGKRIEILHLVGGGTQNTLLNQFTANAIKRPVITGPIEATALGNIAAQAMTLGDIASLDEARAIIRDSSELKTFLPQDTAQWDDAYARFINTILI